MKAKFLIVTVLSLLSLTVKAQSINVHNPAGTYTFTDHSGNNFTLVLKSPMENYSDWKEGSAQLIDNSRGGKTHYGKYRFAINIKDNNIWFDESGLVDWGGDYAGIYWYLSPDGYIYPTETLYLAEAPEYRFKPQKTTAGTNTQSGSGVNTEQKANIMAKDFVQKQMNEFIGCEVWSYSIDPETMEAKGFILNEDKWVNVVTKTIVWKFRDPEEEMIEYIVALFETPAEARNFFQSFGTIGFLDKDYQGNRLTDAYVSGYMDMDFNVGLKDNYVVIGTW